VEQSARRAIAIEHLSFRNITIKPVKKLGGAGHVGNARADTVQCQQATVGEWKVRFVVVADDREGDFVFEIDRRKDAKRGWAYIGTECSTFGLCSLVSTSYESE